MPNQFPMEKTSYLSFVLLGLSVTIPGVAMPFLLKAYNITLGMGGLLFFTQSLGYLVASSSFPWLVSRIGSKRLISSGVLLSAIALAIIPLSPTWIVLLSISIATGYGFSSMDVGLNAAVATMPERRSNKIMHWLHFSFSLGALIGPVLLVRFYGLSGSWTSLYFLGSFFLFILYGVWQRTTLSPEDLDRKSNLNDSKGGPYRCIWFWLMMISMLFYCGAEVALSSWLTTYLVQELSATVEGGGSRCIPFLWRPYSRSRVSWFYLCQDKYSDLPHHPL